MKKDKTTPKDVKKQTPLPLKRPSKIPLKKPRNGNKIIKINILVIIVLVLKNLKYKRYNKKYISKFLIKNQ